MRRPLALLAALALAPALAAPAAAQDDPGATTNHGFVSPLNPHSTGNPVYRLEYFYSATRLDNTNPIPVEVAGVPGVVVDVDVQLHSLRHRRLPDLDVLLVGPRGQATVLMSDVGDTAWNYGDIDLDDEAEVPLPTTTAGLSSDQPHRPANYEGNDAVDRFPSAAPAHGGSAALSAFDGTNPNGTWRLYVIDDQGDGDRDDHLGYMRSWRLLIWAAASAPQAGDDAYRVPEDRPLKRGAATGVLANDADPEGEPLSVRLLTGPAKGTLTLDADGSFVYKPKRNFYGRVSFTYEVEDAQEFTDTATVTIRVLKRPG